MGVYNLQPTRQDTQGNPLHNVMESRIGREMAEEVWAMMREGSAAMDNPKFDWEQVFRNLLTKYLDELEEVWNFPDFNSLSKNELDNFVKTFLSEFEKIEATDTLYEDITEEDGLRAMVEVSGNINLWSTGNTRNHPQATTILRHEVSQRIHNAIATTKKPSAFKNIITKEKGKDIHQTLDFFVENNTAQEMLIAVVDDDPVALEAITKEIDEWKKAQTRQGNQIKVYIAPIRVMRGSHTGDQWPINFPFPKTEADNLHEVAAIFDQRGEFADIPREHRITFLDVDGTMTDDRVMELRQMHMVYTQIMRAIKFASHRYTQVRQSGVVRRDRVKRDPAYELRRIYNAILAPNPPHNNLSATVEQLDNVLLEPLDPETKRTLTEIDIWLRREGFLKPGVKADDVRHRYEKLQSENNERLKPACLLDGQADFKDGDFFKTSEIPIKPGEEEPDIERLISDENRATAEQAAAKFVSEVIKVKFARPEDDNIKLRKAEIKTRISVIRKLIEKIISSTDKPSEEIIEMVSEMLKKAAREITDLVRGSLEVESNTIATAYDELDRIATEITSGELKDQIVCFKNFFEIAEQKRKKLGRESLMQGFKFVFKIEANIPYELQIQTKRAAATGKVNHDTIYKDNIPLPEKLKDYIRKLSWAAHIMDLEECIDRQTLSQSGENPLIFPEIFSEDEFKTG